MPTISIKKSMLFVALFGVCAAAVAATPGIDPAKSIGYVIDQRNEVVRNGVADGNASNDPGKNLCWRTGYWTPALAIAECDPDLVAKAPAQPRSQAAVLPPPVADKPVAQRLSLSADALFDFNKATLRKEGITKIDDVIAKIANKVSLFNFTAVGHADRIGSNSYNQRLSERRALAVKNYMVSKGIAANRIATEGKGETQPKTGDTCKGDHRTKALIDCLQPDRRVEISIIGNN